MKRIFLILSSVALLMGATSCTEEIIVQNGNSTNEPIELTFSASIDEMTSDVSTRSLVRENGNVLWIANDRISLFANGSNNPFITKDGGIVTNFKGTVSQTADTYYALYPYNPDAEIEGNTVHTVLHDHQYAEPSSYASGMNLSVSRSSNSDAQDLLFLHSPSYLCVHISENYQGDLIRSMRFKGNNNELIAGDVTITITSSDGAAKVINNENARTEISLNQINAGATMLKGKTYYFVLAPQVFENGYTLTLINEQGEQCVIKQDDLIEFERNHIQHYYLESATFESVDECGLTESGLLRITSLNCLHEWANRVASGESNLGCDFEVSEIDFAEDDRTWPNVGSPDSPFTGIVLGDGVTIKNFKIDDNRQYAGFINVMGANASVENMNFESPQVKSSYSGQISTASDDGYAGVIVGLLNEDNVNNHTSGTITNCHVITPTVSGGENVGGIVGRSFGREDGIKSCTVSGGSIEGHMFVGGIVGNSEGIIENCHVQNNTAISYHDIQTEGRVGGIVGTNNSGQLVACTANATVNGTATNTIPLDARYCGGIAGANNGTMVGCAFTGTVSGDYGGALAGESYGDIYGCYANNATAKALIYKVKRNLNYEFEDENQTDVVFPTFNGCYWVGASGSLFGEEESYVEEHATITNSTVVTSLSNTETSNMNAALTTVNNDSEYAYGLGYQYTNNTGDDATNFPVKATVEQQVQ
ncbi:hypothetical protein [Parabacteroides sp. An277]|uniref:hypothetical protein n=1 Tax=Parabacteroides sp. An277 TaxID=1965619 RepID=UPI001120991F|nr:hypothetical protein [Parabacteroides sp. An277]